MLCYLELSATTDVLFLSFFCDLGSPNAQSVSHISEILSASPLSDEEIQRLIELLLEKSNDNSEWEAVSDCDGLVYL